MTSENDDVPEGHNLVPLHIMVADRLIERGLNYGHMLWHDELREAFGIRTKDDIRQNGTIAEFEKAQLDYMSHVEALREYLLEEHQLFLSNAVGEGYRVVPPAEQTTLAERMLGDDLAKAFRKAKARISNVRMNELSSAERAEALNAQARVSDLAAMMRPRRRRQS